ncbi:MAG TPA: hypothetical protein VHW02_05545 [Rhizomicrobium sp.]|nr:hypothetical protein [Rhizomicrobium sp.]
MSGMNMSGMSDTGLLGSYPMTRDASGTSWQPDAAQHNGIHAMADGWMLMGHMMLTGIYDTQSVPRGDDKTFLEGMLMGMARRDLDNGDTLSFRVMLSPDPFMGKSGYPLLLASGETANGVTPLIDRQHPHDLFMELSGTYAHQLANGSSVFLYAGYPGEPALGPTAFMHRASGMDIPDAPITHHWLDSTHITFGVVTAGFVQNDWKLEVSQFTGREPDQYRYGFDSPKLDSTSARITWNPDENWSLETSWGYLKSPEQLEPNIDENRFTASATYVKPLGEDSSVAATLAWGLKKESSGASLNGALLETEYKPADLWTLFARAEWEQNNELVPGGAIKEVQALSLGAIRDFRVADHLKFGIGALYAFDFVPSGLKPAYGSDPHGAMIFTRLVAD